MRYVIRDANTGMAYDMFSTEAEAKSAIKEYEAADREAGDYAPGQYEISEE